MDSWCLNPDFLMVCEHVTKEFLHIINVVLFLPVCTWQAKAVMYKNHTACQVQTILKMHFFCKNLVANLDVEALRRLALEFLRRQPAAFVDLVNCLYKVNYLHRNKNGVFAATVHQCPPKKRTNAVQD